MAGLFPLSAGTREAINASLQSFGGTRSMGFPLTLDGYLRAVARETARLSWPGRMSCILAKDAKRDAEVYFTADRFHAELKRVWAHTIPDYDSWHQERVGELAGYIAGRVRGHDAKGARTGYRPEAVAAKLLDVFMHQLMKYEECRFLWAQLHLALDRKVFEALRALARDSVALKSASGTLSRNPYTIAPKQYQFVQRQLQEFVVELNHRRNAEFEITSPIQLNLLWADGHRTENPFGCH